MYKYKVERRTVKSGRSFQEIDVDNAARRVSIS
jgi:hypothetical protein